VAIDALTAEQYPDLLDHLQRWTASLSRMACRSHGPDQRDDPAQERAYIAETLDRLAACGVRTAGWFGADYAESTFTPQLLGELGVSYLSDWANDEQPYAMTTPGDWSPRRCGPTSTTRRC
jgi:allantoinase